MKSNNKKYIVKLLKSFVFAFLLLPFAFFNISAHTYHTSLTRMDYNAKEKAIEIGIQLFVHDVSPMLERRLKKRVDLEKTPEVNAELFKYIQENFVFQNSKGEVQDLKWVGKEFENDVVWAYFEIPFTENLNGTKLMNTIFFESYEEQTNLVIARSGEQKFDFLFRSGDKFKEFQFADK